MTVPFAFANLSGNIALAKLDSNFNTPITIGNTSVLLGNTITTINNVTLANVTISSGTASNISLTSPLAVSSGGTGSANLTVNNVLIGNGTSAVTSVAPGTTGNVLTSIGGAWVSNVALTSVAAGSNTQVQYNSANLLAGSANLTFDGTNLGLAGGTANGVAYLNGSKVLTTGSALTYNGTNFGLGIATPTVNQGVALHINDTTQSALRLTNGTSGTASTNGVNLAFYINDFFINNQNGPTVFYNSGSEQMRLTTTGLGIGTSSPSNKLVVSNAGANGLEINPTSGISSGASLNGYNRSTSAYTPVTYTALLHYFQVGSSPATAATLDSSGNLGLGVTPSAWSGYKVMQLASQSAIAGAGAYTFLGTNWYNDGAGNKYIATAAASLYQQNAGVHSWYNAPSGTAGNAITFTQAMTLDASGNLGLGTTSPNASAILDAQSTTKGVRMPNMTTTQKNAIASPAAGLMVFDTTLAKLCVYSGSAWQTITSV